MKKLRVMVLYGGRSGEHEVSLRSAASVIRNLDQTKFEIVPVAINPEGKWQLHSLNQMFSDSPSLPILKEAPLVILPPYPGRGEREGLIQLDAQQKAIPIDVVFPVMHGTFSEDGALQGFLELADLPYVGCGVLASSVGMDKEFSKRLAKEAGVPIVPYVSTRKETWTEQRSHLYKRIESELGYPVFVKPVNSGSSVGIHKVKRPEDLEDALQDAFKYDVKVIIERALSVREIEFSVLENLVPGRPPRISIPGEITPTHEFYSYEAKYLDEKGAVLRIPAPLDEATLKAATKMASDVFQMLGCESMARVDLFLDKNTNELYFNEVNTLPGFTSISMYPKLWEQSGLPYPELLSQLIELAMARHQRKSQLLRAYAGI